MLIEVIVHCYCKTLDQYAKLLAYQLSSLVLYPPESCEVLHSVCVDRDDEIALSYVNWFKNNTSLNIELLLLSNPQISRRAFGRNLAAKNSKADIVWFADADYIFHGTLDALAKTPWNEDTTMVFPHSTLRSLLPSDGDEHIKRMSSPGILDIDEKTFFDRIERKPIGGTQIVLGDFARRHGYLDGQGYRKWHEPFQNHWIMASTRCDVVYREFCEARGKVRSVNLPGLFRIRHSETNIKTVNELHKMDEQVGSK